MTRFREVALQLFKTKSPDHLLAEAAAPERQLKRALGAFDLTCVGIGAVIGAGIFALAGTAAAGEQIEASLWKTPVLNFIISHLTHAEMVYGRPGAGPAVMVSFVVAAIACGFAALCYAELASMIPVSGSAYTYSVRNAWRDHRVGHRLGPHSRVRGREHGRCSRVVGLFRAIVW